LVLCSKCGNDNPENAKFCQECGNAISYGSVNVEDNLNIIDQEKEYDNILINWKDRCPNCKSNSLISRIHKGTFGLISKKTLECDYCGAIFEKKGNKYKLKKVNDINSIIWEKYGNNILREDEWTNIANGGVSDYEKLQEIEALKKQDIKEFLTELQNGNIDLNISISSPVILKKAEKTSIIISNISLLEPRAVRQTVGGYAGPTIRVAKGVSFKMGRIAAKSESHEELRNIDQGSLILTNKRLIFIGSKRTTNIDLRKIIAIEPYMDGIAVQRENKQKTEYFIGTDETLLSFKKDGRDINMSISGDILKAAIEGNITKLG